MPRNIELLCEPLGNCTVVELAGHEAMDRLSAWTIRVHVAEEIDAGAVLRADATLRIVGEQEGTERKIRLLVTEATLEIGHGRDRILELSL